MPTVSDHIEQAGRNLKVCDLMQADGTYQEWAAVALFYSALHWIDAYLRQQHSVNVRTHTDRNRYVSRYLARLWPSYRELQTNSRNARYECARFADSDVNDLREDHQELSEAIKKQLKGAA